MNLKFLPDTEMGNLIREKAWGKTSLGPIESWPDNLHNSLSIMMNSRFPMFLFWGPELISFYNDAYRPSFGNDGMHPSILGKPAHEAWADIWHIVKKFPEQVLNTGTATWEENQLIPIYRNGKTEDVYWTFSHSPIYNKKGSIEGVFVLCMETTQEVLATKKIMESEERFRTMAENSSALIAVGDETSHAVYFNKAWIDITGRPMEELIKIGWIDLVHPKDKDRFLEDYLSAFEKRKTFASELRMLNNAGAYSWLLINATPRYYADGSFAGYISSGIDITEQKRLQLREKKYTKKLTKLFAQAPFAMCILRGKNYVVEMANGKNLELWGRQAHEVLHKPIFDAMPEGRGQGFEELLNKVYADGESVVVREMPTSLLRNGKKETIYVNFTYQPFRENDGIISGVVSTAIDVTEHVNARKKIEESEAMLQGQKRLYEAVTHNTPDLVYVFDLNYRFTFANEALLKMWGLTWDQAIGKGLEENGYEPWHAQMHQKEIDQVVATKKSVRGVVSFPHATDGTRIYDYIFAPVINQNGEVEAVSGTTRDITEIRNAQEKINENERRFRLALTGTNQIVFSQDKNLKYTWIYNAHPDFKSEDIIGKSDEELNVSGTARILTEIKSKILASGNAYEGEVEIEVGGQLVNYALHIEPFKDSDSAIIGIVGTVTDITERVNNEKKLIESEERFRALADESPMFVFVIEPDPLAPVSYWNRTWLNYTGQSQHEANGRAWDGIIHPDDIVGTLEIYRPAFESQKSYLIPAIRVKRYDGEYRWHSFKGNPRFLSDGQFNGYIGVGLDVHESKLADEALKESEEKFRLLADSMPQFVWTGNEKGELNYFNQAVYDYSGLTKEDIERDGWLQIVHPDEHEENIRQWTHSIETGEPFHFEHRFKKFNGEYIWQLSRAIPQRNEEGKIQMWVGTSTEIQAQKEVREQLEELVTNRTKELLILNDALEVKNSELEKMNKELESFTYISSHDLQEPLRKIQTFATRILQTENQNLSDTGKDYFQRMQGAAARMQRLIQDLLAFSQTNTGDRKFEPVHLMTIVKDVQNELKELIGEKRAIIETTELCELNVIPFQFRQLMYNLINNAIKFTKKGSIPHIWISSEIVKTSDLEDNKTRLPAPVLLLQKEYCRITVKDNGIGFEPQYGERIFEVFQRLHGKSEFEGTGIGLAIVKKIVENHNGFIVAAAEVGNGATFNIYIPIN